MAKKKSRARKATKARKVVKKPARKAAGIGVSVAPGFTVNDAPKSIAWYTKVLGFTIAERWEKDGVLTGAELRFGRVSFNVSQDDWRLGRDRAKGQGVRMYVSVTSDINKYAKQVKARGAVLAQDLTDGWGYRLFGVDDPDGFKVTFMMKQKGKK